MSSNDYQAPDLATVLRTLASLAPQNQQNTNQKASRDPRLLSEPISGHVPYTQGTQQPILQSAATRPEASNVKIIDPATIIEWSSGLRCVMKTVGKHENLLKDIRKMIQVQHEHEMQWWNGRQALIERQKAREESQRKLDDVLKAVGGSKAAGTNSTDPAELAKELETYDMKVYRAQMQMIREMTTKLRNMGVPFFGTKSELVSPTKKVSSDITTYDGVKNEKSMIDEGELVKLQRKMLAILEDMCNE
ncbi:hypothetical protein BP6252_10108 [Coleophoma cylindrospora]|uniref:Uncharacterized protein n=1 Tax=Coleophoma cylindrospora TaxID=1849047 RepID=A0A3D8QXB1_9HELO|nr:hypothetical protein BP6252_10108 [Coleophoma cylindrospora]